MKVWTTGSDPEAHGSTTSIAAVDVLPDSTSRDNLVAVSTRFRRNNSDRKIMIIMVILIAILIVGLIILAFYYASALRNSIKAVCSTDECIRAASNLAQSMDRTMDPCHDFYQYACGGWSEEHPRPDSYNTYDWFNERQERVLRRVRQFLQSNRSIDEPKSVGQARDMYTACMDTVTMDTLSYKPILKYLQILNLPTFPTLLNVTSNASTPDFDWLVTVTSIKKIFGADMLIGFDLFPDPKNRSVNRMFIGAPENTSPLPGNVELEKRLERIKRQNVGMDDLDLLGEVMEAYKSYVKEVMLAVLQFATDTKKKPTKEFEENVERAAEMAIITGREVYALALEAENATKNDSNEIEDLFYHTPIELQIETDKCTNKTPFKIWETYVTYLFADLNISIDTSKDKFLMSTVDLKYLCLLAEFMQRTPMVQIELYIWWLIIEDLILHTTTEMRDLHYQYARRSTGIEVTESRSLYCTGIVNDLMGMAVSYSIADENFYNDTKPHVEMMLHDIRTAFAKLVRATTWMDKETQSVTLEKSREMRSFIGFPEWILKPDKLDDFYIGVTVDADSHLDNMVSIMTWNMRDKLTGLRIINTFGWATDPTNVNAFHTFQANAITVPLAILQFPFYHLGLQALNYGAIGTILGHELTHGFDDSGRQYDKEGNNRQWWSPATVKEYINRTHCFVKQYAGYYLTDIEEYINGELTLGENIADNGGLREAYFAYQLYKNRHGTEPLLPGFENYTHEQLFFMSFANLWCETSTPDASRWALQDEHCPGHIRMRGVLTNSPEFTTAWGCKKGSGMNPVRHRCKIW